MTVSVAPIKLISVEWKLPFCLDMFYLLKCRNGKKKKGTTKLTHAKVMQAKCLIAKGHEKLQLPFKSIKKRKEKSSSHALLLAFRIRSTLFIPREVLYYLSTILAFRQYMVNGWVRACVC